ncbi:hypothetical protein NUW58_g5951 [Xylaria curta]|uniref:Uncharacterized protein n=1 Tax=Xylaria curta TaxID=42375 RepID=A0ACC1P260_9PEZI|nr:hypothetical protein NUW58_g5951 [Xylaria curta]
MAELGYLGLAGNVLQFLQVAIKLAAVTHELYKSETGMTAANAQLEADAEELGLLMEQLQASCSSPTSPITSVFQTPAEKQLSSSVKSCLELSDTFLTTLQGLKVNDKNGVNLIGAVKQAFLNESKRDKVLQLHKRLQELQDSTMLRIVVALREDQSIISRSMRELDTTNLRLEANTTQKLDLIHQDLLKLFEKIPRESLDKALENTKEMASVIPQIREVWPEEIQLDALGGETIIVQKQQRFLKSLRFPEIRTRHESIKPAHSKTFQWVLSGHDSGFLHWLKADGGIYWIGGKAGSGKSTLMRFLVENEDVKKALTTWAGGRKFLVASHFFWNSGSSMQKSRVGLFRTLLFQILRQIPELIETISPSRWNSTEADLDAWSEDELLQALQRLPLESSLPLRFCFFVDGLDEYTAGSKHYHGDFKELIELFHCLSATSVIKVCVSSRPWTAFNRAFEDSPNKLKLEDLTKDDIKEYVLDKFHTSQHFRTLAMADPRCVSFGNSIVQKAQGVFLWVYLVVDSLLRGASAEDNFEDLQLRLNELPEDLEEYFKHMLETIEPVYWEQTARILQFTIDAEKSLPLLAYEFLDHITHTPDYDVGLSIKECSYLSLQDIHSRMSTRLNARCKDLLEVLYDHEPTGMSFMSYRVDFLHRTVRDFFLGNDFLTPLVKTSHALQPDPNVVFFLAESLIQYVHKIEQSIIDDRSRDVVRLTTAHTLLDELDHVNSGHLPTRGWHWTNFWGPERGRYGEYEQKTFLAYAIEARLLLYVTAKLDADPELLQKKKGRPLLDYALRPTFAAPPEDTNFQEGPDVSLVKLLLSRKASPNKGITVYDDKSPWHLFLLECTEADGNSSKTVHTELRKADRAEDTLFTEHFTILAISCCGRENYQKAENQELRKFFDNELRFDYTRHPSKGGKQFVIHVPSTFREEMARKISYEIVRWLGSIASGRLCRLRSYKAEAMRIASEITPTLATRVRFDEPYDGQLQPDLSFTYGPCAIAGLVVEVAWSQSNLNLAERATRYIEGQNGAIRTVVGLNMNDIYHGGCLATFSVWKAKWDGDTWRCTTAVDNKVKNLRSLVVSTWHVISNDPQEFLDEQGQVVNRCYLSLSLQDFVCEKKAGKFKEFEDVLLEIPSTRLYTFYTSALKRHVMGEAMEEIEKLKRKVHDSPDKLPSAEKPMQQRKRKHVHKHAVAGKKKLAY